MRGIRELFALRSAMLVRGARQIAPIFDKRGHMTGGEYPYIPGAGGVRLFRRSKNGRSNSVAGACRGVIGSRR